MTKTQHPYAEILRAIADGETVQRKYEGHDWEDRRVSDVLNELSICPAPLDRFRIKPRTIRVGEVDVPEPMREAPEFDALYWVPDVCADDFTSVQFSWHADEDDLLWFSRGLCYSDPADAETAGRAIAALFAKDKS